MKINLSNCLALLLIAVIGVFALGGCAAPDQDVPVKEETSQTEAKETQTETEETKKSINATKVDNQEMADLPRLDGKATIVMTVKGSPITMEIDGEKAPVTAGNFVDLVNKEFYDGIVFHRVVKEPQPFVAQGGDPQSKNPNFPASRLGTGGYEDPETGKPRYVPLEITPEGGETPTYSKTLKGTTPALKHTRGAVAMARSQMPDSASSQFYIALADLPFLDGDYAVFGYVTEGMDVVDQIQQGDKIESAKVTAGLDNLKVGSGEN